MQARGGEGTGAEARGELGRAAHAEQGKRREEDGAAKKEEEEEEGRAPMHVCMEGGRGTVGKERRKGEERRENFLGSQWLAKKIRRGSG